MEERYKKGKKGDHNADLIQTKGKRSVRFLGVGEGLLRSFT